MHATETCETPRTGRLKMANATELDNAILDSVYNDDLYDGREEKLSLAWEPCSDVAPIVYPGARVDHPANVNSVTIERARLNMAEGETYVYRFVDDGRPSRPGVVQASGPVMYRLQSRDEVIAMAQAHVAER